MKSSGRIALDVLLDAAQRLLRDGAAVRQRDPEEFEPQRRARCRARQIQETHALGGDLEVPSDMARDTHSALRSGALTDPDERARRRPGVAEDPHQRLDALLRLPAHAAEHLGDFLLQLVGQQVDVAAAFEVQNRANALKEIFGLVQLPRGALEFDFCAAGFQLPDVPGRRNVAETPWERS